MRLLSKPVGKTAKTSCFSRRAITACSCSFFSLIPPNFTSHARCMISAILHSFVYYNFARRNFDDRYLSSIRGQPIKILRHQSAGRSNRCMKPVQSLFSLVFRRPRYVRLAASHITLARKWCFEFFLSCFPTDFSAKERLLAV